MKALLILPSLLFCVPAVAQTRQATQPFTYETPCALESDGEFSVDTCKVIETREKGGALKTRNIYSNRFGLTVKGRFDKKEGYMTWDSHNKFEYKWEYKVGGVDGMGAWTMVMPGVLVQNVSWD